MRYALTAAALVLLLAAACSSGTPSDTGAAAETTATTEAATEATTEATAEATGTMTDTGGTTDTTGTAGATGTVTETEAGAGATAHADLMMADGAVVGVARFTETQDGGVMVQVDVQGVAGAAAGDHGIHVHMVGACDPPDFMSAGEHFNPTAMKHGLENPDGPHAGDMPNMTLDDQGSGTYNTTSTLFTLSEGANPIMDGDGSAIIIHADPDDQVTDPSGNSGARLICGVIMADAASQ